MKKEETYKCLKDTPTGSYKAGLFYNDAMCAEFPEYFAKFLLTTKDGIDYYDEGKSIYVPIESNGGILHLCATSSLNPNDIYYSTREAYQAYLDEQNKPKFEKGKIYTAENGSLFCFVEFRHAANLPFGYGFLANGEWCDDFYFGTRGEVNPAIEATPAEWESALVKEAERRYTDSCQITNLWGNTDWHFRNVDSHKTYFEKNRNYYDNLWGDVLYFKGQAVMLTGKWAEIVKPEKEKTTE